MRALLAQLSATDDVEANARRVADSLEQHPDVDIAVFPELFLCNYALDGIERRARSLDAPEFALVGEAAARRGTAVVVGFAEAREDGIANSAACFGADGALAGVYRKTQLFGPEARRFVPGDELLVVPLAGRKVGVLICFDIEFPEPARQLALAGAEVLVTASANMKPYYSAHELASRARALDNRLPHAYVNLVGMSEGLRFVGGSRSVGSDGDVLAEAEHGNEELLVAPVAVSSSPPDELVDYLSLVRSPLTVVAP